jgi:ferric-dicitrate binding protein FerR (iron transport regulator)
MQTPDELPAPSWRRRAAVLLLALAMASAVMALLIWRPGDPKRGAHTVERVQARPTQPASGVGGPAQVRLLPALPASTPAR